MHKGASMFGMHGGPWMMVIAWLIYFVLPIGALIGVLYLIFGKRKPPK